jgi:hypothetical protein
MPLQAALASLALHRGNVPDARREATRFLECSLDTSERTWQARAWETSARVALAEGDRPEAQQAISNALALCASLDLPLAALHVYPTAMQVFPERAEHYSQLGAANARRLAGSLEGYDALRKTFLSSTLVRSVLPDGADEGKTG